MNEQSTRKKGRGCAFGKGRALAASSYGKLFIFDQGDACLTLSRKVTTAINRINPPVTCSICRQPPKQPVFLPKASTQALAVWLRSGKGHALSCTLRKPQHWS